MKSGILAAEAAFDALKNESQSETKGSSVYFVQQCFHSKTILIF